MSMLLRTLFALFLLCVTAVSNASIPDESTPTTITLLHTNDVHARFEQVDKYAGRCRQEDADKKQCFGGTARLKTKVDEIRTQEKNVLFLNAGDYYQGTLYYTLHKWNVTATFVKQLKYDAMALGNHEFDDGVPGLEPFLKQIQQAQIPVLACNMDAAKELRIKGLFQCSRIVSMKDGKGDDVKVGIIGFITPDTKTLADPGPNVVFTDEIEALKLAAKDLKSQGVNIIIALGHSGYAREKEIADKVEDLDIVVGGHSHTFLYTGTPPSNDEPLGEYPTLITRKDQSKALVVQAYAFGLYLGFLSIDFDSAGQLQQWRGSPIYLDHTVPEDGSSLALLAPYKVAVDELGLKEVGSTQVLLRGDRGVCRRWECNLGNMLTDAMVDYYRVVKKGYSEWPIRLALWQAGGIRASIEERQNNGAVTYADVLNVAPFSNTIDLVNLTGDHLRKIMEHSIQIYDVTGQYSSGAFLQMSGLKVVYDLSRPVGSRVSSLRALCSPCRVPKYFEVNDTALYRVAIPTYLVKGGDGFQIKNEQEDNVLDSGDLDAAIIISYFERMSPVVASIDGRITFLEKPPPCTNAAASLSKVSYYSFQLEILVIFCFAIFIMN